MKLINLFLIFSISLICANKSYSQSTHLSLKANKSTIKEIFKKIENNSDYIFFYYDDNIDLNRKVNIDVTSQTIDKILDEVFEGTNNTYIISDRQVFVLRDTSKNVVQNKSRTIRGNVTDINSAPLIGAYVVLKNNPSVGTVTDVDGNYTLDIPDDDAVIQFKYVGYLEKEEVVGKRNIINVVLQEDLGQLEEVVVVGYGTQKKESVIGAISSLSPKSLKSPVAKVSSQLAGQLSGVLSVQRSGEPGAGSTFWIRGISTFGEHSYPLVLVDGIEREMDLVNPEDIKEFSVLKDAAATAVYGVRGANGVVLITTRSGEEGAPKISIKAEYGILAPTKVSKMVDAVQFAEMYNDAIGYEYYSPDVINAYRTRSDPDFYPNVNWVDELYKNNTTNTRINANVSGGSRNFRYYVSGAYYGEDGLFIADKMKEYDTSVFFKQYNFRSNIDIDVAKYTTLNVNLATTFEQKNEPGTGGDKIWTSALQTPSNAFPMVYSNGYLPGPGVNQGNNPYALLTQAGYIEKFWNTAQSLVGITQDFSEYITKGLKANLKVSFDARNINHLNRLRGNIDQWLASRNDAGEIEYNQLVKGSESLTYSESKSGSRMLYIEGSINYARVFGLHNVTGLFLYQQSQKNYVGVSTSEDALPYRNQGIAGRLTYNYDSRYFIEGNFGYNGSENFSPGNRFGFFPSFAVGWLVSNEQFFQPLANVVDMLKLKTSYGLVGNDQIGGGRRFIYLSTIDTGNSFSFGKDLRTESSIRMGDWANDNVGWETSRKLDIGIDVSLFNKVKIQFDYFKENRSGIFLQRNSLPYYVGITSKPYVNLGKMKNSGFDASIDYHQKLGDFRVTAKGNFTYARNVIVDQDQPDYLYLYQNKTGQARWQKFGYIAAGLFKDQEDIDSWADQTTMGGVQPGDIKYKDLNGDGIINSYDQKAIGYRDVPEVVYGFGASVEWKGFDLSAFFQGNAHVEFSILSNMIQPFINSNIKEANVFADIYDNYWRPDRTDAKYPRLTIAANANNNVSSTYWMADGSYLRLKNLEFGYTFPAHLTKSIRVRDLRVFFTGVNLLTFSNFKLWDPDLQTGATKYPPNKVYNLGLSVSF